MQFRILGPLEVADGDCLIALAGAKQRGLLALLLLGANEVVSSDRLIEELWGEQPPESGRAALQVRVSQLRKALGGGGAAILTRAPGYVLRFEEDQLDLHRFERLVAEADGAEPAIAAAKLREALALWRGPALADLAYESFAQPAIRRLEEMRLAALERRIDADLALARHANLVGELETLVAEHPLRERFYTQLMLALYRCGRQADALAVYQTARRVLVEGLGIDPSAPLRELEGAVLRQDPSLDLAPAAPERSPSTAPTSASSPYGLRENPEPLHNLPAQISSFVGRERELNELRGLLPGTRMLTLIGAGGVGKTRLALQLAANLLDGSRDGVWFVDLAPLADASLVAAKVAAVLGVREAPGQSLPDSLLTALRSRELLVILDNCEHVIDEAAKLADQLLKGCQRLAILATSREPLRIAGEHVYRVPSLSLPSLEDSDARTLLESEAVRLFVERARQHRHGFAIDRHNGVTVARVCRTLDGIPLAIELAAARLSSLSLGDLNQRLDQRFLLLTGASRTAMPRQRTLEALIDWSYDLLRPAEQETLERLSVFAGGFDLHSAEAVTTAGAGASGGVVDQLAALVDKSLVQADYGLTVRYRLLDSVREYAAAKLSARGETAATAVRWTHRDYFLALAETAAPHLVGQGQVEWLDRLHLEIDNLRAAISACLQDPDPRPGLRMGGALRYFWIHREPTAEGAAALREALDRPDAQAVTLERARALVSAAVLLVATTAQFDTAAARAEQALEIARTLGDERLRVEALCALASVNAFQGNEEKLLLIADEGLRAARTLADPQLTSWLLTERAKAPGLSHAERVTAYEECLNLERQAGNQVFYLRTLNHLAALEIESGKLSAARTRLAEAVRVARAIGDKRGLSLYTCNLGFASYLDGDATVARTMFDESVQIAQRNGDLLTVAGAQLGLALLASLAGDTHAAATLHGAADAIHAELGARVQGVESLLRDADIARLRAALGDAAFETAYELGMHPNCTEHAPLSGTNPCQDTGRINA